MYAELSNFIKVICHPPGYGLGFPLGLLDGHRKKEEKKKGWTDAR